MVSNPRRGSNARKALDLEIGKHGRIAGKIIAQRDFQPSTAFHHRTNRCNLRPACGPSMCIQFFRPKATGRMEFSPGWYFAKRIQLTALQGLKIRRPSGLGGSTPPPVTKVQPIQKTTASLEGLLAGNRLQLRTS